MKPARSPIPEGSIASMRSRTRRATTGEAPPVPTATTTSPRSTIAGKMKVECTRSSITLMGRPIDLARSDIATPISPAPAQRMAMTPDRSAASGSPFINSIRAASEGSNPPSSCWPLVAYQRTRAPADASTRSLARASSPVPTRSTGPALRSRNTGRNRMHRSLPQFRGLTGIFFYICLDRSPQRENFFFSLASQL